MGKLGIILNIILVLIMVNIAVFAGYYWYNMKNGNQQAVIFNYNPLRNIEVNASARVAQFYDGMRFNHNNISYYINEYCSQEKIDGLRKAMNIVEEETAIIKFSETSEEEADILVGCYKEAYEKEESIFVAGEGGPTRIINSTLYPVITRGKILLYNQTSCEYPVTELHEILHVFGFEHINDSSKIMFPYVDCNQKLNENMIKILIKLYSMPVLAEIYFINASALASDKYLNLSVEMTNVGMKDANNVSLAVYADNSFINDFEIGTIEYGEGRVMHANNLDLPSKNVKIITIELETPDKEIDKNNNIMEMVLEEN